MERHHFCFASDFLGPVPIYKFQNKEIAEAAAAFHASILRVQSLGRMPILLTGASIVKQTFDTKARVALKIADGDPGLMTGHPNFDPVRYEEKETLSKAMQMDWFLASQRGEVANGMIVGEIGLAHLLPAGGQELDEAIAAVLSGMLTETWTAFEVLVEDVWNTIDALKPLLKSRFQGEKHVGLRALEGIRKRFDLVFPGKTERMVRALDDPKLEALSLMRNVIAHKKGLRDEKFNKKAINVTELKQFVQPNSPPVVQLSGITVRDLLKEIPNLGLELAIGGDEWLQLNP